MVVTTVVTVALTVLAVFSRSQRSCCRGVIKVGGTTTLVGTTTVDGHNVDPSTYGNAWCDCYREETGTTCNQFGTNDVVDAPCPSGAPVTPPIPYGQSTITVSAGCQRSGYFPVGQVGNTQVFANNVPPFWLLYPTGNSRDNVSPTITCCRPCLTFS